MTEDLYRTLNLGRNATPDEIHRAYRALAMKYHPDRNSQDGADTIMASVNRAYEVLSEPGRRSAYDSEQTPRNANVHEAVIEAARSILLKRNWTVVQEKPDELVLRNGSRRAHISFAGVLDSALFDRFHQRSAGFCAVLAVHVEPPVKIPPHSAVVIDLMHSRIYGGDFPDTAYRELFKAFLP